MEKHSLTPSTRTNMINTTTKLFLYLQPWFISFLYIIVSWKNSVDEDDINDNDENFMHYNEKERNFHLTLNGKERPESSFIEDGDENECLHCKDCHRGYGDKESSDLYPKRKSEQVSEQGNGPLHSVAYNGIDIKKPKASKNHPEVNYGDLKQWNLFHYVHLKPRPEIIQAYFTSEIVTACPAALNKIPWKELHSEWWRLHTFKKYPQTATQFAIKLAQNGFAYFGDGSQNDDSVICIFCHSVFKDLDENMNIEGTHKRINSHCPMVNGINNVNKVMKSRSCKNVDQIMAELALLNRKATERMTNHPSNRHQYAKVTETERQEIQNACHANSGAQDSSALLGTDGNNKETQSCCVINDSLIQDQSDSTASSASQSQPSDEGLSRFSVVTSYAHSLRNIPEGNNTHLGMVFADGATASQVQNQSATVSSSSVSVVVVSSASESSSKTTTTPATTAAAVSVHSSQLTSAETSDESQGAVSSFSSKPQDCTDGLCEADSATAICQNNYTALDKGGHGQPNCKTPPPSNNNSGQSNHPAQAVNSNNGQSNTQSTATSNSGQTNPAQAPVNNQSEQMNQNTVINETGQSNSVAPANSGSGGPSDAISYDQLGIVTARPKRREYALEYNRLQSYTGWPPEHHIKPEDLAKAGYFYTGYSDCARCFYCGGGLRNWEIGDNVWVEHARWFPKCAFIRQQVGQEFVDAVKELNKDKDTITLEDVNKELEKHGQSRATLSYSKAAHLRQDAAVLTVMDMGFSEDDSCTVAAELKENGLALSADILYKGLVSQRKHRNNRSIESDSKSIRKAGAVTKDKATVESLHAENSELRQQSQCKICMDVEVSVVFLPCGHYISCYNCSSALSNCPLCRETIMGYVRAYMT